MIPYGDDQGRLRVVVTTAVLCLGMIGAYVYQRSLALADLQALVHELGFVAPQVVARFAASSGGEPARDLGGLIWQGFLPFVSYPFLHSGPIHVATCVLALWTFGSRLESRSSWWRFLFFFLLCSVVGGLAQMEWGTSADAVYLSATVPVGCTALTYLVLYPKARIRVFLLPLPLFARIPAVAAVLLFGILQFHKIQAFLGLDCGVSIEYVPASIAVAFGGLVLGPLLLGWRRQGVGRPEAPSSASPRGQKRSTRPTRVRVPHARNRN